MYRDDGSRGEEQERKRGERERRQKQTPYRMLGMSGEDISMTQEF